MHYVCEVLLPPMPADEIYSAVGTVLEPFSENQKPDEDGYVSSHTFWDWWVIGGRWASHKLTDDLDQEKLDAFYQELKDMKITVSSLQAGKQNIDPPEQIPAVDATWKKYFPEWDVCPLFAHYHNQYSETGAAGDVMELRDVSPETTCATLLIAAVYERNGGEELRANELYNQEIWNGITWQETTFDGKVLPMIEKYKEKLSRYAPEFATRNTPTDDWLLVTVDYHS